MKDRRSILYISIWLYANQNIPNVHKGLIMSEEQILKDIEEMMQVVQKEKEEMIKMLAMLEAENQENPFPDQISKSVSK